MEYICQEIFARLIMYNFTERITSHVVIRKTNRKFSCKANSMLLYKFADNLSLGMYLHRMLTPLSKGMSLPFAPVDPDPGRRQLNAP